MRFIRTKAAVAGIGLALSLAACGDAGSDDGETVDVEVEENAADEFEDGTAMKELAEAGEITIGVKYDQPGIGFKGADRRHARPASTRDRQDPRGRPRHRRRRTSPGRRRSPTTASRSSRTARSTSSSRRTPSPTSAAQIVGQAGPYYVTGQQLLVKSDSDIDEPRRRQGHGGLLGDRLDLAGEHQGRGRQAARLRHLLRVRRPGAQRHRRRDDHRRRDPAGLRRRAPRRAQGRRRAVLRGAVRRRLLARTTRRCASGSTTRSRRPTRTARGTRRSRPRSASPASTRPSRRSWTPARPDPTDSRRTGPPATRTPTPARPREEPPRWTPSSRTSTCTSRPSADARAVRGRPASGSLVLGTLLAALRVGPVAVLRRAAAALRHALPQHPAADGLHLHVRRGAEARLNFSFVEASDRRLTSRRSSPLVHRADALHLGLRLRGDPLRRQRRPARPGRGGPRDRAHLRPVHAPGRAPPGVARGRPAAGQRADRAGSRTPRSPLRSAWPRRSATMRGFTNDNADRPVRIFLALRDRLHRARRGRLARRLRASSGAGGCAR